jgi:hypothetical protein
MIEILHNFDPHDFMWLWAKYVTGFSPKHHCTNCIRGRYSRKLSKHNDELTTSGVITMDEYPQGSFEAIYICGVAREGYSSKENYRHNVHTAISPRSGASETWSFEKWQLQIRGGTFLYVPTTKQELPSKYSNLPSEYTDCRIFRWSACYFDNLANKLTSVESKRQV